MNALDSRLRGNDGNSMSWNKFVLSNIPAWVDPAASPELANWSRSGITF